MFYRMKPLFIEKTIKNTLLSKKSIKSYKWALGGESDENHFMTISSKSAVKALLG